MVRFIFIRHAKSGTDGIYYGGSDVEVQPSGKEQEKQVLLALADKSFECVISSNLKRCRDFAEKASSLTNSPLLIEENFSEINLGNLEGTPFSKEQNAYKDIINGLHTGDNSTSFAGGESVGSFRKRTVSTWQQTVEEYKSARKDILIIGHGGVIHAILAHYRIFEKNPPKSNNINNCR
jgi:alpha-ribazole phosphatase